MIKSLLVWVLLSSMVLADTNKLDMVRSKILTSVVSLYFKAQGYGTVENVTIDTTKKSLHFVLLPEGEVQKLTITIGHYEIDTENSKSFLVLQEIQTNRIWLTRFLADHLKEGIKISLGDSATSINAWLLSPPQ